MGDNLGFQERWEFRRKEINEDSSSDDDSKSNSEQVLKSRRLIVEGDYHSDNPAQVEQEERNPRTKSKSKCRKPRQEKQSRVTKRNKLINEKADHVAVKNPKRKKNNSFAYDPRLMEDLKSFSDSLLNDMRAAGEKICVKMKEEMFELQSRGLSIANNRISKMGYAQVLNQRNVRYNHNQMPPGPDDTQIHGLLELSRDKFTMDSMYQLPTRENADVVRDFSLVPHQQGLLLGRGLPNTSSNQPFVFSGGRKVTRIPNIQHQLNFEPSVYLSRNIMDLQSSGRVDSNIHDMIRQNSLSNFELGTLLRNEASDQSPTRIATYEREIIEVEHMKILKAGVPFMNDGTRQLQAMVDERASFSGKFSGPIVLRQKDNKQTNGMRNDPNFNANFSSQVASSMYLTFPDGSPNPHIKSQIIRPSTIQHITSGNQAVMTGGFSRMRAEGSIQNGYLEMEQNNIRSIPQIGKSDREQCNAPNCSN